MDFTIEGKLYYNGTFQQGSIGIKHGKIIAIKKNRKSDNHLNVGNNLILPTGIDLHVHFRDPGFTHKEDFSTGSLAAAYGGISCIFDMPNNKPQITNIQTLKEKTQLASQKSYVDFGLYSAVNDENVGQIAEISSLCTGFKIFLGSSTNTLRLNKQNLRIALLEINQTNKITLIHAEDNHCLDIHRQQENTLIDHNKCRSAECEEIAIRTILKNASNLHFPLHICHLSSSEGFELLKKKSNNISVGVTPHHLFFEVNTITTKQTFYKVNPPIRSSHDRNILWSGVNHGLIDIFESDHAPHTEEEKKVDFNDAPAGVPGVETMYPLLLTTVKKRQMTLNTLLNLLCEKPAQLMNLPKGKIEIGRDADFMVINMKKTETIESENLHSKCGWTPYEGFQGIFPSKVFIRGEKIIDDNQMIVKKGFGKCVGV